VISAVVRRFEAGEDLTFEEMSGVVDSIMRGGCSEDDIRRFLTTLSEKGEAVAEVAGAAAAMRNHMTRIRSDRAHLIDTCGTGGDGSGTFNISTAAAMLAAAAGAAVAKHGNHAATSKSGSATVLEALGVHIEAPTPVVERCLRELGVCFCFARNLHPAMKHVAAVRRQLGKPTIFNILGPLCNPASAPRQLLGAGSEKALHLLAEALLVLGTERAIVVRGEDGLDEITLAGRTDVLEVCNGKIRSFGWTPADFGLVEASNESMLVEGPEESADLIRSIFAGRKGPPRDIVVMNAAAALWLTEQHASLADLAGRAAAAIDSGAASALVTRLAEMSRAS